MDKGYKNPGSAGADGMTQSDCAAVYIDLIPVPFVSLLEDILGIDEGTFLAQWQSEQLERTDSPDARKQLAARGLGAVFRHFPSSAQ